MNSSTILLGADEVVAQREFTHPELIFFDVRILRYMMLHVRVMLESESGTDATLAAALWLRHEPDGRQHRVIFGRVDDLAQRTGLTVVGFFGQRRLGADSHIMEARDQMLADEVIDHPGLLSYSSLELTHGDYGNLVLFADEIAKDRWGQSRAHDYAARELAPSYYGSVRIYNGEAPGGLHAIETLSLACVKYFDYRNEPHWQALRPLAGRSHA